MSRVWVLGLNIKGTEAIMDVRGEFSREAMRQACIARGWHFDEQRRDWRGMPQLSRPSAAMSPVVAGWPGAARNGTGSRSLKHPKTSHIGAYDVTLTFGG
jgi:hypothetical protein